DQRGNTFWGPIELVTVNLCRRCTFSNQNFRKICSSFSGCSDDASEQRWSLLKMFHALRNQLSSDVALRGVAGRRKELSALASELIEFAFRLFHGRIEGYQACDSAFHDFDHTLQATIAVLDLLEAHKEKEPIATLIERDWEIALAAVLLHDSGYLKKSGDCEGSGAKYSTIHVGRSCFLAWDLLPQFGFQPGELRQIQYAICATSTAAEMARIGFRDQREWLIGALVGTGDMLGQMAADDYPERLAGLYLEFREASNFSRFQKAGFGAYQNLLDLLEGTEKFFSGYVIGMLEEEWRGVYSLLTDRNGHNQYLERIRANIKRVNSIARTLSDA
ncbi:MAG: hypothetical protein WB586_15800, partial [Chthoniobacterales bacterium]